MMTYGMQGVLSIIIILICAVMPSCIGSVLMFCNTSSTHIVYGHENGTIVSPNYPAFMPLRMGDSPQCTLNITVCASCRIKLNFTELWTHWMPLCLSSSASRGSCIAGCDHLYIHEPGNEDLTFEYVTTSNIPLNATFMSKTRMLSLRFCQSKDSNRQQKKFAIPYEIIDKAEMFHGRPSDIGEFRSLGYPRGYSSNGDIFVYHLHNDDTASGRVRLSFSDWNISPFSMIIIYPHGIRSNLTDVIRATGSHARPFVTSNGCDLVVEFHASTNLIGMFVGFKAHFEFIRSTDFSEKPWFVEEYYFTHNLGGSLSADCLQYSVNDLVDHLWVMPRPPALLVAESAELMLRITDRVLTGADYVEIRQGNNSEGNLIPLEVPPTEYIESTGLYIHLRMRCNWSNKFKAVFAWIRHADVVDGHPICQSSDKNVLCVDKHYCISPSLHCDGTSHCADSSDEHNCSLMAPSPSPSQTVLHGCSKYFYCLRTTQRVCIDRFCDGFADCSDMTDELNCGRHDNDPFGNYSTLGVAVPVILVSIIVFVVICTILGYMFQRRRRMAGISQARQLMQHRAALRAAAEAQDSLAMAGDGSGFTGVCLMDGNTRMINGPPSYEDTIIFNNMAFVMPESVSSCENRSLIQPPPPYSPDKPEEQLHNGSVRYIVASSRALSTRGVDFPPNYASCGLMDQGLVSEGSVLVPTTSPPLLTAEESSANVADTNPCTIAAYD